MKRLANLKIVSYMDKYFVYKIVLLPTQNEIPVLANIFFLYYWLAQLFNNQTFENSSFQKIAKISWKLRENCKSLLK